MIATLTNVLYIQGGYFSITAKITVTFIIIYGGIMFALIEWHNRVPNRIVTVRDRESVQYGEPGLMLINID